jgi:hypothetical protein
MAASNKELFNAVVAKAGLKQEVYANTLSVFNEFKKETMQLVTDYHKIIRQSDWPIAFEYKDRGTFEFELKFGSDILVFFMHTNVFEFSRDHEVMKSSYIKQDKRRSYCGIIHVFNFLADSFKYNRSNDIGYLIGRVFVNRESHYFIEGKREVGLLYNNFRSSVLDKKAIGTILRSSIEYTLNFDLLTPPYENLKEVTVQEMQTTLDNYQIRTGKRLGFRFQADPLE